MRNRIVLVAALLVAGAVLSACQKETLTDPGPGMAGNVAVLVVDDFGLGRVEGAEPGGTGDNCAVVPGEMNALEAGELVDGGAGDDAVLPASHGELVYEVLRDELELLLGTAATSVASWNTPTGQSIENTADFATTIDGEETIVRLKAVNTDHYLADDLIAGLLETVDDLSHPATGEPGFTRFVLNLSFVVIPCDLSDLAASGASQQELLDRYKWEIANDPSAATAVATALAGLGLDTTTVTSPDLTKAIFDDPALAGLRPLLVGWYYSLPLASLLQVMDDSDLQGGIAAHNNLKIIPVAAAGNGIRSAACEGSPPVCTSTRQALQFPFAPALWDSVLSVGADAPTEVVNGNWYNRGEVAADATYNDDIWGTSFAAPRVSARTARYLATYGLADCNGITPAMSYVGSPGSPGDWQNISASGWPNAPVNCPSM